MLSLIFTVFKSLSVPRIKTIKNREILENWPFADHKSMLMKLVTRRAGTYFKI